MVKVESITRESFALFGSVLEFPAECQESFCVVDTEEVHPWRIAVFRYTNKAIKIIENHPTSKESFEPLAGITVLLVAEHDTPEEYKAFVLDKPVSLKKGVWHQVLALTPEAQVKITENLEVESEFYEYKEEKSIFMN